MAEKETTSPEIPVNSLGGLNERVSPAGIPTGQWHALDGLYPARTGLLERIPGKTLLRKLTGKEIWHIHQCFDPRNNLLIQTENTVEVFTLDEMLGRAATSSLANNSTVTDDEIMPYALIVHKEAVNVNGGTGPAANTWQQRKLTDIVEQKNADGTNAAFVTALGNGSAGTSGAFTLAAGTYRIRADVCAHGGTTGAQARLYNITTAAAAWPGAINQGATSHNQLSSGADNISRWMRLGGTLTLASPAQFEIQQRTGNAATTNFYGKAVNQGENELYAWVEILKTA